MITENWLISGDAFKRQDRSSLIQIDLVGSFRSSKMVCADISRLRDDRLEHLELEHEPSLSASIRVQHWICDLLQTTNLHQEKKMSGFYNNWIKVCDEDDNKLEILKAISARYPIAGLAPQLWDVESKQLTFYSDENSGMVRARHRKWKDPSLWAWFLVSDGHLIHLDGAAQAIYDGHKLTELNLDEQSTLDYTQFFCRFVCGDDGAFNFLSGPNDPVLSTINPEALSRVIEHIEPAEYLGPKIADKSSHLCKGVLFYGDGLFRAHFEVRANGLIEMLEEESIIESVGARIHAALA